MCYLLILFVSDCDITSSIQQQLTDVWMTHLSGKHQWGPTILQTHKYQSTHLHKLKQKNLRTFEDKVHPRGNKKKNTEHLSR